MHPKQATADPSEPSGMVASVMAALTRGPCTVSELAEEMECSRRTIQRALAVLVQRGDVTHARVRTGSRGQPPKQWRLVNVE